MSNRELLALKALVVHPMNRAGVFPNGGAVQTLGCNILLGGFSSENANAEGVVVQEVPGPEQMDMPDHPGILRGPEGKYLPYMNHNVRSTKHVPQLRTCFDAVHQGAYGTLSHSHLLLVLLALRSAATWDLGEEEKYKGLKQYQDPKGAWDFERLVAVDPALGQLVQEGLWVEVLSWELYRDDPEAAMLISAALNRGHNLGLKQSEVEALQVLAGQMPAVQGAAVAEAFVYEQLLERAHLLLTNIAEDADFKDLVGFVATMGAASAPWVPEFVAFANAFVNSSERRLRLAAFGVVNKMPDEAPRAKLAVLFRAYRQKPNSAGVCPMPESIFHEPEHANDVRVLEELLYYWWKTCAQVLDGLPDNGGLVLRATVAIRAAEVCARHWSRAPARDPAPLTGKLLRATLDCWKDLPTLPRPRQQGQWVQYAAVAVPGPAKGEGAKKELPVILPKVLAYDAEGAPLAAQETRTEEAAQKPDAAVAVVPFREWLETGMARELDQGSAHMGAIQQVLHALHLSEMAKATQLRVVTNLDTKTTHVSALADIPAGSLRLPPCAPHKMKLHDSSVHPERVAIKVRPNGQGSVGEAEQTYYIRAPGGSSDGPPLPRHPPHPDSRYVICLETLRHARRE